MKKIIALGLLLLSSLSANAAVISILSSNIGARADDASGASSASVDLSTALGFRSLSALDGLSSSTIDTNWVVTDTGALLDFDFSHVRSGARNSSADSYEGYVQFTVNQNTTYSLSGMYSVIDLGAAGVVSSMVQLQRALDLTNLFVSHNFSKYTVDEILTVGALGDGDFSSMLGGTQTGTLVAGTIYNLYIQQFLYAEHANSGASATGCVTLSIGGATGSGVCGHTVPAPVPAPAPLMLLVLGLVVLGCRKVFKKLH